MVVMGGGDRVGEYRGLQKTQEAPTRSTTMTSGDMGHAAKTR